jgi:hypothetical protein
MPSFLAAGSNSQNGKNPKNIFGKIGRFLAAKKHHTKHHNCHAFHHKLTTFSPSQNTKKSQNPQQKPAFPS